MPERLEDLKARFWKTPTATQVFAPVQTDDVQRAEALLGVRLPTEYIALLEVQNGGYVSEEFNGFPTRARTSWADDHVWFRALAGIGPAGSSGSLTMNGYLLEEWGMPAGLVLLSGDGPWWIALD